MYYPEQPIEDQNDLQNLTTSQTLTVNTRSAQLLGGIVAIGFALFALFALSAGNVTATLLFVVIAIAGGILAYMAAGTIEMNTETITLQQRGQRDRIRWDEVSVIEKTGDTLIFKGKDKYLVLIEPMWWRGPDRAAMMKLLSTQIKQRALPVRSNILATLKRSHNTRVE